MSVNQQIKNLISSTEFRKPEVRINVSFDSLLILAKYGQKINEKIQQKCQRMNFYLESLCRNAIDSAQTLNEARDQLRKMIISATNLQKIQAIGGFKNYLSEFEIKFNLQNSSFKEILGLIEMLEFITTVNPNVKNNLQAWKSKIHFEKFINELTKDSIIKFFDDHVYIDSPLINLDQVGKIINARRSTHQVKSVTISCSDTFFIDSDFIKPGLNLIIKAKNWKVSGDFQISLKGFNGQNYPDPVNEGQNTHLDGSGINGCDGKPGKPGQTGGSFFGKIMPGGKVIGIEKLTIDVSGGNGGNGQNGGNGTNGRDNEVHGTKEQVQSREQKYLVSRQPYTWEQRETSQKVTQVIKAIGTFNSQMLETYRAVGEKGARGGDAGKGGAFGIGGLSGLIQFRNYEDQIVDYNSNLRKITQKNGQNGKSGNPGKPGKGGMNGITWQGLYINQSVFTSFRKVGDIVQETKQQGSQSKVQKIFLGTKFASYLAAGKELLQQGCEIALQGTSNFTAGILSCGIALVAQTAVSVGSAFYCSEWKVQPYVIQERRTGPSGQKPEKLNYNDRIEPKQPFNLHKQIINSKEKPKVLSQILV